jgi:hypothetical protein
MIKEKRKYGRVPIILEAVWDGTAGRAQARTADLSEGGCFIDTVGQVAVGEPLELQLQTPSGDFITIQAEVIYHMPRFGFGIRFTEMSDEVRTRLTELIQSRQP